MPDTYIVRLVGGPCNGEDKTISAATLAAGQLTCGGTLYLKSNAFPGEELIVFATSEAIGKATSSTANTHAAVAWHFWMHGLAHKGPAAHNRLQRATARARRLAR